MASSKSSSTLSFSTGAILLLLLPFLLLGCFRPSSSAVITRTDPNERWRNPCAGGTAAEEVDDVYVVEEDTVTMTTEEALDSFTQLSSRATALKEIVNLLKNEYVLRRFVDARHAAEFANGIVNGSPTWNVSSDDMSETLQLCYENLARLAVLTRFTREGEQAAETREVRHFASAFLEVEHHAHGGLNALMCDLHGVMTTWGIATMTPETEAEVTSIRIDEVQNSHRRHVRDYVVLLALENSADKLSESFDRLVGQVQGEPQTTVGELQTTVGESQTTIATSTEQ